VGCVRRNFSDTRGGALFKLLVALVVLCAAAALAWMLFLPSVLTSQLRTRTGFDATVQSLAVNPFTGNVELRGLVVSNPPTFAEREFIEVREFHANLEVFSLLSDRLVFSSIVLDVPSVTLVVRADGQSNAISFQHHLTAVPDNQPPPPPSPPRRFLIRHLTLRADKLVIVDHSHTQPSSHEYHLGLNQNYTDVTNVRQLLSPAALESLAPVGVALTGLGVIPGEMGSALSDALKGATKSGAGFFKSLGHKAGEKVKGYFDALEESRKP
jgi:uncharacterized protein involved in outer membrane biogenesis